MHKIYSLNVGIMKNKIILERSKIDTYYFQIKGKTVIYYQLVVSSCLDS